MKIYVTGCSSNNYNYKEIYSELLKKKHTVVIARHLLGTRDKADILALLSCEAIMLLPGWQDSKAANIELLTAKHYDLDVIYMFGLEKNADRIKAGKILGETLDEFNLLFEELASDSRKYPLPDARHIFFKLVSENTRQLTNAEIGEMIKKDHSTVNYGIGKADELMVTDKNFRNWYYRIKTKVDGNENVNGKSACLATQVS